MNGEMQRLRAIARIMDDAVRVPGTNFRIGLDALFGLIPGAGDLAGGLTTAYTIVAAQRLGAPRIVLLRMFWNVVVDTVFGSIPVLGDLFDAAYRANRRNVQLLEAYSASPVRAHRSSKAFMVMVIAALILVVSAGIAVAFLLARALWTALF
jgi:hypothetical protein